MALILLAPLFSSCCFFQCYPEGGLGPVVQWDELSGWQEDRHAEAWPSLLNSCDKLKDSSDVWRRICNDARLLPKPDDETARAFFESRFVPRKVFAARGENRDGLITGYYEPLLEGSLKPTKRYRFPVYQRPADLLVVDLGGLYEDLKGKRIRGRLVDKYRVVPYFSREQIEKGEKPLEGNEIAWVDDPVALFFLHIQGSGIIRLRNGRLLAVGYRDQNGHPYYAIGRRLIEEEIISEEEMSMQAIRQWLRNNPDEAAELLNSNPSYVFFDARPATAKGPIGSLGVPLVAERSIAVDRRVIPLGAPVWLDTTLPATAHGESSGEPGIPDDQEPPYRRLVFAQDTGGAINGSIRADLFWGRGRRAENYAGRMRQPGAIYLLQPAVHQAQGPADEASKIAGDS